MAWEDRDGVEDWREVSGEIRHEPALSPCFHSLGSVFSCESEGKRGKARGQCHNPGVCGFCALLCLFAAMARGERGKAMPQPAVEVTGLS
jgi:hypothetical protein